MITVLSYILAVATFWVVYSTKRVISLLILAAFSVAGLTTTIEYILSNLG